MRIDIWSDIACPWCYIGLTRFRRALDAFPQRDEVEVVLHSFLLDPDLPESYAGSEVDYLSQRKGISTAQVEQMIGHVAAQAVGEGLTMDFDALQVASSRRAHRLLHEARHADATGRLVWDLELALLEAHFADGESISDPDTLVRLAEEVGLDADAARASLDSPAREEEVQADLARAGAIGVSGVPFFVLAEKYGLSGAQPAEAFAQALARVWAELHPGVQKLDLQGMEPGEACGPDGC
ncbi:protein disulfide isomerase FrnE [Mariniluteicoccus endophyticus]